MAVRIEVQLRRTESELRAVGAENPDVVARWGNVSALGFATSEDSSALKGLSSQDIAALPSSTVQAMQDDEMCSICVDSFVEGDCVRCLDQCGHKFHQSCI